MRVCADQNADRRSKLGGNKKSKNESNRLMRVCADQDADRRSKLGGIFPIRYYPLLKKEGVIIDTLNKRSINGIQICKSLSMSRFNTREGVITYRREKRFESLYAFLFKLNANSAYWEIHWDRGNSLLYGSKCAEEKLWTKKKNVNSKDNYEGPVCPKPRRLGSALSAQLLNYPHLCSETQILTNRVGGSEPGLKIRENSLSSYTNSSYSNWSYNVRVTLTRATIFERRFSNGGRVVRRFIGVVGGFIIIISRRVTVRTTHVSSPELSDSGHRVTKQPVDGPAGLVEPEHVLEVEEFSSDVEG
ncbi:hypothetical protein DH2020_013663 [Rehmannia glutinosa]|uniref:Uncharacterized protein n=1 Tax=Rehmannia glutinosa TaxID=99300 RepID=A0ABR0X684_REHGL